MGEARAVMRTLKEERDEIRGQLDAMQVYPYSRCARCRLHAVLTSR